jgi:hypothetical protein
MMGFVIMNSSVIIQYAITKKLLEKSFETWISAKQFKVYR